MKKTKIVNQNGFMLVETLIVTVFIMGIFTLLYTNLFPVLAEYEKETNYDTVEGTYLAHWARVITNKGLREDVYLTVSDDGYQEIDDCNFYYVRDTTSTKECLNFRKVNKVSKIYLTTYSLVNFKNEVKDNNNYNRSFQEYIASLPTYAKNPDKENYYRIIIEYQKEGVKEYANIELGGAR